MYVMSTKLLVVMPLYNAENTVREAITSILEQTHKNLLLTIVDDASTDNSLAIAQEFLSDPRVSIYSMKQNRGAYHARNLGLYVNRKLDWNFFTTHDADDISFKFRYKVLLDTFKKDKVVGVQDSFERKDLFTETSLGSSVSMAHAVFRRVVFDSIGYFDSSTRFAGDWEHWRRAKVFASQNNFTTAIYTDSVVGVSYVHGNNLTVRIPVGSQPRLEYVAKATKKLDDIYNTKKYYFDYKIKADDYKVISAGSKLVFRRTRPKMAVVLLTWQRINNLHTTLSQLSKQTVQDFDVVISNANEQRADKIDLVANMFKDKINIHVRHDGNEFYSFRRLLVAKDLYNQGYDSVVFLDDDVEIPKYFMKQCFGYYEPKTYKSWYAWVFDGSGEYYNRERVNDPNAKIHYGGAGVSMLDLSIFKTKKILSAPKEAHKIEDLWISFAVSQTRGWSVKYLPVTSVILGGADSVALHKVVQGSEFTKTDFLQKLMGMGWKL